jgi:hypothetical protein
VSSKLWLVICNDPTSILHLFGSQRFVDGLDRRPAQSVPRCSRFGARHARAPWLVAQGSA